MGNMQEAIKLYLDLLKKALTASIYEESSWKIVNSGTKNIINRSLLKYTDYKSLLLVKARPFDRSKREEGRDQPIFGLTMAGHRRLDNVQKCIEDVLENNIPGDLIETGVWRGGTTIFMRAILKAYGVKDRKVWVADSFEGMPTAKGESDGADLSQDDFLRVSLEQVKSNFEKFDLLDEQVEFLKGWFCDTLPNAPITSLSILRLDGDMYSSTMDSLQNLYPKVSKSGYVIVDDYYAWPSCRKAVTDYLEKNSIEPEIKRIDWTGVYWKV